MKIALLGAAGFIGTNLVMKLAEDDDNEITAVDKKMAWLSHIGSKNCKNVKCIESKCDLDTDFEELIKGQDVVYHLLSTTVPGTSNIAIAEELQANVILSTYILEACVKQNIKKVVFLSSGGTVYGKESKCPLGEDTATNPISSYGLQKVTIERLLYLYNYMYGLDYRIIRLSNPYGPYQRPDGVLGAVTTFTYKSLRGETIEVYGDGSVVRDFIYIDDAIRGILNIVNGDDKHRIFNLGCGYGTSIRQVLETIGKVLRVKLSIRYTGSREVDVPVNFLDISRYEKAYGKLCPIGLEEGIEKLAQFILNGDGRLLEEGYYGA